MGIAVFRMWVWLQFQMAAARRDQRGQGLVEYALIIALVAILVIGALVTLRGQLTNIFDTISNCLGNSSACTGS